MAFIITGAQVTTSTEVVVAELELEAQAMVNRAILESKKLQADGMSKSLADKTILKSYFDGENFVKVWNNHINKIINEMTKQLVAKPVRLYAKANPEQKYEWVLGSVKTKHCTDCESHSLMEPQTISEWESHGKGLPRDGDTVCNVGCKCLLKPIDIK